MKPKARKRELYVEGGGDHHTSLASECRRAFSKLFTAAGIPQKPGVIACGGRKRAYDQFCDALKAGTADARLLVDAEDLVTPTKAFDPWTHVKKRKGDGWKRPAGATDDQLHLMTVCMETWLLADRAALIGEFGSKLDVKKLPAGGPTLESQSKASVYNALKAATKPTPAGEYGKGAHSFRILANVDPAKLDTLPWAKRLLDALRA